MNQFLQDVVQGLNAKDKFLYSKYFYDSRGDLLFQKIMACSEYYPTDCEMEIFTRQTSEIVSAVTSKASEFDVVELGAGDATKSIHVLKQLLTSKISFTYFPVDISNNVISTLEKQLPQKLPALRIQGLNGEYLSMLEKSKTLSDKRKVVLFLGGNIGNVPYDKAIAFCKSIRQHLAEGDMLLTGFDLKKDPRVILAAYNDKEGYTKAFNLNLLTRINEELSGDFIIKNFDHYPTYDPATGACKSYLVSTKDQHVNIADQTFSFYEGEPIFMEIAQKYTVDQTNHLAHESGFICIKHLYDSKKWFLDTVWQCV